VSIAGAAASGQLPNRDAVLWARESVIASGGAAGTRAIDVHPWDGIGCRLYPDRGLDIGQAWYQGVPLAWVSAAGERGPLDDLDGMAWGSAFGGGLVTTCGLRNVGMPSEGHGLHGTFSHLAATDVRVEVDEHDPAVAVAGVIDDPDPVASLRLERTIRIAAGAGRIEIEDVTTHLGTEPTPAPLLYHCNFGYPLWSPPARLEIPVVETVARDPESRAALGSWHEPPEVVEAPERVLEHVVDDGWARLTNEEAGIVVEVRWDAGELPRLNQWIDPNPGMAVLGIEPANCSTRGRGHDRAAGVLPMLEPGDRRVTRLHIEARPA
jgi:hypothetical protein